MDRGAALDVSGVTFRHPGGSRHALDGLSFRAREATITGLLGPNGAGKTTFVSLLCGVARPQGGSIRVHGVDHRSRDARASIGYCPQELALYTTLSARENLRFFGRMAGLGGSELDGRVEWCLDAVRLQDAADKRVEAYSGGMQRRLNLATALVHGPRLIVLDEPTVGVDMESRHAIFETLEELSASGTAILYTTHYMEEVERLCEDVVVIDHGRVLTQTTTAGLLESGLASQCFRLAAEEGGAEALAADLRARGVEAEPLNGAVVEASATDLRAALHAFTALVETGRILSVETRQPTLEERFLELTRDRRRVES